MGHERKRRRSMRHAIFVLILLILSSFGVSQYLTYRANNQLFEIRFETHNGTQTQPFMLKVANTNQLRQRGLMFVKELYGYDGMLFVFPTEEVQSFWMKNTYIPLDMIFVNEQLKVVGVLSEVPVLNELPRTVGVPSRYVVELAAGVAKEHNISAGSRMLTEKQLPSTN